MNSENGDIVVEDDVLREGFTQVPNRVLRDPKLSPGAKLAYASLLSYAWRRDSCFPGQQTLAEDMGCGLTAVKSYLGELVLRGYITAKRRGLGRTNLYTILRFSSQPDSGSQGNPDGRIPAISESDSGHPVGQIPAGKKTQVEKTQVEKTQTPLPPASKAGSTGRLTALRVEDLNKVASIYPTHRVPLTKRPEIAEAWNALVAANRAPPLALLVADIDRRKGSYDWTRDGGRYVPNLLKYLAERMWNHPILPAPVGNRADMNRGGRGELVL